MNKPKYQIGDRFNRLYTSDELDEIFAQIKRGWDKEGCVICPQCDTTIYKESPDDELLYCDVCGYDF